MKRPSKSDGKGQSLAGDVLPFPSLARGILGFGVLTFCFPRFRHPRRRFAFAGRLSENSWTGAAGRRRGAAPVIRSGGGGQAALIETVHWSLHQSLSMSS